MALVIEDGTIIANANSFVTRAEIIAFAALRGVVIADEDASDVFAIKAADFLAMREPFMQGVRVSDAQTLPYPRDGVVINGAIVGNTTVPTAIKTAQILLAIAAHSGIDLTPSKAGGDKFVIRQKLGPIEREFSEAAYLNSGDLPTLPQVEALLYPYLKTARGPARAYRV